MFPVLSDAPQTYQHLWLVRSPSYHLSNRELSGVIAETYNSQAHYYSYQLTR